MNPRYLNEGDLVVGGGEEGELVKGGRGGGVALGRRGI